MGYVKAIIAGFILIMGISIGWGASDMIKVKPLKAEVAKLSVQLESVISINQGNDAVMIQAKDRYDRMALSYEKRLKDAAKKCDDILVICNLPASKASKPDAVSGDKSSALLDRLNGLYP